MVDKRKGNSNSPTPHEWAIAEHLTQRLSGSPNRRDTVLGSLPGITHPAILVQAALEETFRPASPTEVYSDEQPIFTPQLAEQERCVPIDVLFGCYSWKSRIIKIFHKNIVHFAITKFNCLASDLELIVRLHEYAHALIHLGLFWKDEPSLIRECSAGQESDWNSFLRARSAAFRSLPPEVHEFLAQVVCWITIGKLEPLRHRDQLQELFITVMERQSSHYVLAPEILGKSHYADPTLLISWARKPPRCKPPRRGAWREVAEELLRVTFP